MNDRNITPILIASTNQMPVKKEMPRRQTITEASPASGREITNFNEIKTGAMKRSQGRPSNPTTKNTTTVTADQRTAPSMTKNGTPTTHGNGKSYVHGKDKSHGKRKPAGMIFSETPSPTSFGRKKRGPKPRGKKQQNAATNLPQFVASAPNILPPLAAFCHRQLPEFVAICRSARRGFISL